MRAVVLERFGGPEVLTVGEIPEPRVGPEDVLIRVIATALNRADLAEREGRYPPPGKAPQYEIPGLEAAGIVERVGERVTGFEPGDRVMALLPGGGYAEFVAVHERLVMPVPEGIPVAEAAAIPEVFLTAYDALFNQGGARPGSRVLVHAGASGVGSAALQIARETGMRAMATVGSQLKAEAARAFGAEQVTNYREQRFLDGVEAWSQSQGVDVILDFVGQAYLHDNLKALAPGGTLVLIGALSGYEGAINLGLIQARRLKVHGTALRSRPLELKMGLVQQFIHEALWLFDTGRLKPVIDRAFPLDAIQEAHRYMESNQNIGKILIRIGQDD